MNAPAGPDPLQIRKLFASISGRYDLANRILSLGLDQAWRRRLIDSCLNQATQPRDVLDLACGTGDVATALQARLGPSCAVTGGDLSNEMLARAKAKSRTIRWVELDATALPFENESYDLVTIAFGLRNVNDPALAVREMYRVLRPGGVIGILEFGKPHPSGLGRLIQSINRIWLKSIGGQITGHPWAYQYLSQSSEKFPGAKELEALALEALPHPEVNSESLFPGICYTLTLRKPKSA